MDQKKPTVSLAEKRRLAEQRRLRVLERKALAAEREEIRAVTSKPCQVSAEDLELQEVEEREARHRRRRQDRCQSQIAWLDQRSRKPKGRKQMLKTISETPLGQLWLSLCHADGQVNCLTRDSDVSFEDREHLLMAHYRLRLRGFTAAAVAKVCPVSLLSHTKGTLTASLEDLPEVDPASNQDPDVLDHQERQHLQQLLGL